MTDRLPKGWTTARVEDIATLVQYGSSSKTSDDATGVPVLRMGNIVGGELVFDGLKYLPTSHHEFPELHLQPGDVLFNRTNSPELVGKTAVYTEHHPAPCSFASYLIRVKLSGYEPKLLASYLNSTYGRAWIRSCVVQQVGQANVSGGKLKDLELPLPPLNEQRRIVAKLDALQERSRRARASLDAVPALLDKLRQSILAAAFRGDLTRDFRAQVGKLGSIARFIDYRGKTPTKTTSGVPLITAKNIRRGFLSMTPREFIDEAEYASWMTRGFPRTGDVLITTEAPLGNVVCIDWTFKFALAQRVICLQPDEDLVFGPFLALMMQSPSFQTQLVDRSTGTTVTGIKASRLKELEVPLPPLAEQRRIVSMVTAKLERVAEVGACLETELHRIKSLDRAILAKAFRGELVPQDPSDEPADELLARVRADRAAPSTPRGRKRAAEAALHD